MTKAVPVCVSLALCLLIVLATAAPLRLHVVANSDSAFDQQTKLAVRDAVLKVMADASPESEADAETLVLERGLAIQTAAENALAKSGADYGAALYLGDSTFPDKAYGDAFYPAGEYRALRVVLGEGGGQNWWCVIYPPLCLADADTQPVRFRSFLHELYKMIFG